MPRKLARVAIVGVLAMATLLYGALEKHVTVRIEGKPISVRTYADTVAGALDRAGVTVGPDDRVVPSRSTAIHEGSVIQVFRAKAITLLLDGTPRRVIVTGLTVQQVLDEVAVRGRLADFVHPSRGARVSPGMTIVYDRAVEVTVAYDGHVEPVVTNATSVATVVKELGIALGARDRLDPAPATTPAAGMQIKVLRVGLRSETQMVTLPFTTILRRQVNLEYGLRKLVQTGQTGLRRVRYESKYVNGVLTSRRVLGSTLLRAPRDRIIAIGAGFPGCVCNRGTQTGSATWYSQAQGLSAAHPWLPLGTVVRVENLANGKWVNVVIRDRGPYGSGRIIDLSDEAFRRIASLSSGVIKVRIRW
ncbi:MAG: ubiquitin-like domain-containing protein [Actinomycetota bacterium]